MALTANHSPLVAGGIGVARASAAVAPVRLVRAICIGGERIDVDTVLQLDRVTASDLVSSGKAVRDLVPRGPVQTPAQAIAAQALKKSTSSVATPPKKDTHHAQQ